MALDLGGVGRKDLETEIRQEIPDIYDNVQITMVLPDKTELNWDYPYGESVQTLKKRLIEEHSFDSQTKLFLEEGHKFLMDPLSLNDHPVIKEIGKKGQSENSC